MWESWEMRQSREDERCFNPDHVKYFWKRLDERNKRRHRNSYEIYVISPPREKDHQDEMIPQNVKPAAKQLTPKGGDSSNKKKSRLAFRSNLSTCKVRPEALSTSKSSSGPACPDVPPKFCQGRPKEDHPLKLELMELTPRDPASQASQGVQDFIKQVSRFIEKKNPFKVTPEKKSSTDPIKSENHLKDQMLQNADPEIFSFDKNSAKLKKHPEKPTSQEKKNCEKTRVSKSRTLISAGKAVQREHLKSLTEAGKADEPKKMRRYLGGTIGGKRELKAKPSLKVVNSRSRFEGWDIAESASSAPPVRQNPIRRPPRSEIPLRKTRTDMSKNPKFVSLLTQKPLKEVESAISIDFYSKKKPFTPIEELSLCSEILSLNVIASTDEVNHVGKATSPRRLKKEIFLEEASNGFKLDRCFKSPNIPVASDPSCSDVAEQKLCAAKRSKVLDLDKIRTSSFTVLQNGREALCRLESLHQQNVSTKENVFEEKVNSSKLKVLTPKTSFNSLKVKGSKKNFSTRLSSKGKKPALKFKVRKPKKDESLAMLKQSPKANIKTAQLDVCQKGVASATRSCFMPAVRNEEKLIFRKASDSRSMFRADKETAAAEESSMSVNLPLVPETELGEQDKGLKSPRNSGKKAGKQFGDGGLEQKKSKEKVEFAGVPLHGPESALESSSPEDRQTDEDERSSSKTVTLERPLMVEMSSLSSEDSQTQFHSGRKTGSKVCKKSGLTLKGTSLKFGKDEPPEKPKESEPKKNKIQIKINLATPEDTDGEENANSTESLDRLYLNSDEHIAEQPPHEGGSSEAGKEKEEGEDDRTETLCLLSGESTGKEQFIPAIQKSRKSSPLLRSRLQYKVPGTNLKGVRKKKIRSDAGDRRLPSSTGFFKSISFQNKIKLDTKLRSGLTKAYNREEERDLFDDNVPIKLKRRNSEPISFRGYIWKRADSVTPRGHKASVSSMASSLKHLNNDDIDDFIFWEAVPQKMTSCWEMSLYHFKRPWSVLSCSVFEGNRQSNTPGLILENLRNGGSLSPRRSALNSNDKAGRAKGSPFDVEPSIAQKNIDIRNWLAALNFPTPPSTSIDIVSEGNFSAQSRVDGHNVAKGQVSQKRRKVLASLRFSEETVEKNADEKEAKYKKSAKWNASEVEGLMDLIRRKSGGFVSSEQFLNSEHSIHRPNVTVNLCLYSKGPEEKLGPQEASDRNVLSEQKTFKTGRRSPSPEDEKPALSEPAHADEVGERRLVQKAPATVAEDQFRWARLLKGDLALLPSDLNIWKYLFLFTLLVISVHYCFLNNSVGRG